MRQRRYTLDITPSWDRPRDYEWYLWPLFTVQRQHTDDRAVVVYTARLLFLRIEWSVFGTMTPAECVRAEERQKRAQQQADNALGAGRLNEFLVAFTPAPFDHADRRWLVWPLVVHRKAANGLVPMTRNGNRVWRDESLVFQCAFLRLRFTARGELSRRTIDKQNLLERLPDIAAPHSESDP